MTPEEFTKEAILEILKKHTGQILRISRSDLLHQVNTIREIRYHGWKLPPQNKYYKISDRQMRAFIEELRTETTEGAWICSDTTNGGYYIAVDMDELMKYLGSDRARGKTIIDRVNLQEKHARERQPGIQERML